MSSVQMRTAVQPLVKALVAALKLCPELAAFSLSDRPVRPSQLPHVRIGPVEQEPWSTSSSAGARLTVTLSLTSKHGGSTAIMEACEGIKTVLDGDFLTLADATIVAQSTQSVRFEHDPSQDLERALMKLHFLVDFGDIA